MKKIFALFYPEFNNRYSDQPMNVQTAIYEYVKNVILSVLEVTIVGLVFSLTIKHLTISLTGNIIVLAHLSFLLWVCVILLYFACAMVTTYAYIHGRYTNEFIKILEDARKQK